MKKPTKWGIITLVALVVVVLPATVYYVTSLTKPQVEVPKTYTQTTNTNSASTIDRTNKDDRSVKEFNEGSYIWKFSSVPTDIRDKLTKLNDYLVPSSEVGLLEANRRYTNFRAEMMTLLNHNFFKEYQTQAKQNYDLVSRSENDVPRDVLDRIKIIDRISKELDRVKEAWDKAQPPFHPGIVKTYLPATVVLLRYFEGVTTLSDSSGIYAGLAEFNASYPTEAGSGYDYKLYTPEGEFPNA